MSIGMTFKMDFDINNERYGSMINVDPEVVESKIKDALMELDEVLAVRITIVNGED